MTRYSEFDRQELRPLGLSQRGSDLKCDGVLALDEGCEAGVSNEHIATLADAVSDSRRARRPVVLLMGGHPIKLGLSRFLVDLIERNFVTHVATNGAGIIHDFELAMSGGTSENVAKWINVGQFGLWEETSRLNDIVVKAAVGDEGLGEAVGRVLDEQQFPNRDISICAAGYRCGVPVTSHVTIGGDIIHAMPNCDGAALGKMSYTDFLIFAHSIQQLEGGVFLNIGSAVTGPEVYLKALSMARNVNRQREFPGLPIEETRPTPRNFTTAVFDMVDLPDNWHDGPPGKDHPLYYYRPWKTILCRTVADGGTSYYIKGDFRQTIPAVWYELVKRTDPEYMDQLERDQKTVGGSGECSSAGD